MGSSTAYTANNGSDYAGGYSYNVAQVGWNNVSASDGLQFADKHVNGGLGTVGAAVQGYNNIGNDVKRAYAYKLSRMTGLKSGQICQGAKGFANITGKLVSKLGPVGTLLGVSVAGYELSTGTWDAHTAVNIGLMAGLLQHFLPLLLC